MQYVQEACKNVIKYLEQRKAKFNDMKYSMSKRDGSPMKNDYRPEIDDTPELGPKDAAYYQSLIGVLRWIVELGRVDIVCEVSMMSSCLALPREGHLQALFHFFSYFNKKHNTNLVYDPTDPEIDMSTFPKQDWLAPVYATGSDRDLKEAIPTNLPEPRGKGMRMRCFVDSDHAGDVVTRRSRTGFIVFLQSSLIYWTSKKQTSIETSFFGSEFTVMKHATEYIRGLRYKLRAIGIPVTECAFVYGDNQSVLVNSSVPDSMLKKKSNSYTYHFV